MLTNEQKRELEAAAAEQLRRNWGVVKARPLESLIDDIRARVIEEGWWGRPLTEVSSEVKRAMVSHDLYGLVKEEEERVAKLKEAGLSDDVAERS